MAQAKTKPVLIEFIWFGFVVTQLFFFGVGTVVAPQATGTHADPQWNFLLPLMALFDFGLAYLLPKLLFNRVSAQLTAPITRAELTKAASPALVVRYSLLQFITLIGLGHAILAHNPMVMYPYALIGILPLITARPTPDRILGLLGL